MEKKQTAVDWIVSKLSITFQTMYSEEIEQAKQMGKEQILLARLNGFEESAEGWNGEYPTMTKEETILRIKNEEYYNENYL